MDDLRMLLARMATMRREACRVRAAARHGSPLFAALDALEAGCDQMLNVVEDEVESGPLLLLPAAA